MTTAAPERPDQLEELLGDRDKIDALLAEPEKFKELLTGYVRNINAKDKGLLQQAAEQTQATLAEFLRDNGQEILAGARPDLTPDAKHGRNRGQYHNRHAPGANLDGLFESTGDLMKALFDEEKGQRPAAERLGKIRDEFSSAVPGEGGFLIPEEFRAEMLRVALETAVVRPRARVIPMGLPRVKFPMIDSPSNAGSVYGGIVAYWTEEAAALIKSSARFGQVTLDAHDLTGYAEIPNGLLADSAISVGALVDQVFPEALAWFEDLAFIRGSGVGEPLGMLSPGNTSLVSVAKEAGQPAGSIVWENIAKMFSRMLPAALARAVWVAHIDTFPELATMALSVGTGGSAVWLNNGVEGPPMTILGRPVIFTEKAESVGTKGDINLVDWGHYLIGDRQQMTAATSEHFQFSSNTTAYRIIQRVDGKPWLKSPITPAKGANTLSPAVQLATRA